MSRMQWIPALSLVVVTTSGVWAAGPHEPRPAIRRAAAMAPEPAPTLALVDPAQVRLALLAGMYGRAYLEVDNLTLPSPEFLAQSAPINDGPFSHRTLAVPPVPLPESAAPAFPAPPAPPRPVAPAVPVQPAVPPAPQAIVKPVPPQPEPLAPAPPLEPAPAPQEQGVSNNGTTTGAPLPDRCCKSCTK